MVDESVGTRESRGMPFGESSTRAERGPSKVPIVLVRLTEGRLGDSVPAEKSRPPGEAPLAPSLGIVSLGSGIGGSSSTVLKRSE